MKCPNDQATLLITERKNIEIDYCPECRGIWLDRGELDKLIEAESAYSPEPSRPVQREYRQASSYQHDNSNNYHHASDKQYGHKKKRKESFLGDLFDF